jgi:hypothetical protein
MTTPGYTVLGAGRWAGILVNILTQMGRHASAVSGNRRLPGESDEAYEARLRDQLQSASEIVWIAVPPGPHVASMARAALEEGRHVIVEKPWLADAAETRALELLAVARGLNCAVHYQYCLLDQVRALSDTLDQGRDAVFSGQFTIGRVSLNGIPATLNLGSHLVSLWLAAFPRASLGTLVTGYEQEDRRYIELAAPGGPYRIDFTGNAEPIVQRFITGFETGAAGPVSLALAAKIGEITQCL